MIASMRRLVLGVVLAAAALGPAAALPLTESGRVLGSAAAKVTVVEYASLSCPHCAHFHTQVFPAFKAKYIDTGKVKLVYREFLTSPVDIAAAGALIARCAPKERYFAVLDAFYKGQAEMYRTEDAAPLFKAAGAAGGLSESRVKACLADKGAIAALQKRVTSYINKNKIQSTPTFVVNGRTLEGDATLESLSAAIDPLLAASARP